MQVLNARGANIVLQNGEYKQINLEGLCAHIKTLASQAYMKKIFLHLKSIEDQKIAAGLEGQKNGGGSPQAAKIFGDMWFNLDDIYMLNV
ncbi:hypothetical protein [Helicobacter ailurogastricus]|uniref:hypothetical protein n=1 Tax=Helicobacter ailurogastricus TaxID=1578720 RepID=UPI0012E21964|nr:hypothetical protein [Helicobacter ailurogastricus]